MRIAYPKAVCVGALWMCFLTSVAESQSLSKKSIDELKQARKDVEDSTIDQPKKVSPPLVGAGVGQVDAARRASENLDRERSLRIQEEILRKLQ